MNKKVMKACLVMCCLSVAPLQAIAQEIVHALAGTVTAIDAAAKTITVKTDDGSENLFKDDTDSKVKIDFDKDLRAQTTAADAFAKTGARVIVYYYGFDTVRTAVALENLGSGPFVKTSGTVLKLDRHKHLLTIETSAGSKQVFEIGPKTVAETSFGAVEGEKVDVSKGENVRVTASPDGAGQTALFINAS
jgi:outer membrane lipoprotein-sorting protein